MFISQALGSPQQEKLNKTNECGQLMQNVLRRQGRECFLLPAVMSLGNIFSVWVCLPLGAAAQRAGGGLLLQGRVGACGGGAHVVVM